MWMNFFSVICYDYGKDMKLYTENLNATLLRCDALNRINYVQMVSCMEVIVYFVAFCDTLLYKNFMQR